MNIILSKCTIRSWRQSDAESLAHHANNRKIWLGLRDAFPHPYSIEHAHAFIKAAVAKDPQTYYCIEVDGKAVGSIGLLLHSDVERVSAEIGYWLSEEYWGKGIVTEALKAVTQHAVTSFELTRVYAVPYATNEASHRVLEKAGYEREGRLRANVIKDGCILDQIMYAFILKD